MTHPFTSQSMFIALLAMCSCNVKAETIEHTTEDGFTYILDTDAQEASLKKYRGDGTKVVVPASVTYGQKAYKVTSLGEECFMYCSSLTAIVIPESVASMGDYCFQNCSSLTAIVVPESVTSLGNYCFTYCSSLTTIELPASVTSLGTGCFSNCHSLNTITCKMVTGIEDIDDLFEETPIADATLYVSEEGLPTYKSISPWKRFGSIRPLTKE